MAKICDKCKRELKVNFVELCDKDSIGHILFDLCEKCFDEVDEFVKGKE